VGRFLDMIRSSNEGHLQVVAAGAKEAKQAKKVTPERDELMERLSVAGISLAIDRSTEAPLLIFRESDAGAVRHVATVYKPFEVQLTEAQRREVTADLAYSEGLLRQIKHD